MVLQAKMKKRFKVTTKRSAMPAIVAPNYLEQRFTVDSPNLTWVGDITYGCTSAGWLYLAIVLDLLTMVLCGITTLNILNKETLI